jgi:hypothetical protein
VQEDNRWAVAADPSEEPHPADVDQVCVEAVEHAVLLGAASTESVPERRFW